MTQVRNVAVIVGSLRKDSVSRKLAKAFGALTPNLKFNIVEIGDLPHFDQDLESDPPAQWVRFRQEIADASVLNLIEKWLKAGRREPDRPIGIPLGAVLSPLFCNIYLHRLDEFLTHQGYHPVRYADDFCVFCLTRKEALAAWKDTARILERLHLRLEPAKTNLTHFEQGFDYLGIHFYRDTYTFIAQDKRVKVRGAFDPFLFYDYVPEGYQG